MDALRGTEGAVLTAFSFSIYYTVGNTYSADFEHGQWWITCRETGHQWSVVDTVFHHAEGNVLHLIHGFDFETVTEGSEE